MSRNRVWVFQFGISKGTVEVLKQSVVSIAELFSGRVGYNRFCARVRIYCAGFNFIYAIMFATEGGDVSSVVMLGLMLTASSDHFYSLKHCLYE